MRAYLNDIFLSKLIIFSKDMKLAGLLLIALFSLSRADDEQTKVCQIPIDKYDRAAMYSRNFMVGQSTRWPDNTVPYKMSSEFSPSDMEKIREAMKLIEEKSCIKFVNHTFQGNYVNIFTGGSGCYATLGFNPFRKEASLHLQKDSYCMVRGTIAHEMLHSLGFAHEHTRPDRDQYLKIHWDKIAANVDNWFRAGGETENPLPPVCNSGEGSKDYDKCYAGFRTTTLGVSYDYGSVMHYHPKAGSKDGSVVMDVLKPIPSGVNIGQREGPSDLDFKKLNKAYPCDEEVTTTEPANSTNIPEETTTTTTKQPCEDTYPNCKSLEFYCEFNAAIRLRCKNTCGLCSKGEPTTTTKATTTTTKNEACYDRSFYCRYIKPPCESSCIQRICQRSCEICTKYKCRDNIRDCVKYRRWCGYAGYVRNNCKRTCGRC